MSILNTPKRVMKSVSNANQRLLASTNAGNWESFTLTKRKTNLIAILAYCALKICSENKLKQEIHQIKEIFFTKDTLVNIISKHIFSKIFQFSKPKVFGPDKHIIYFIPLFIGSASLSSKENEKTAVENCYSSLVTRLVHVSKPTLLPSTIDLLPVYRRVLSFTNTDATATVGT